MRRLPFPRLSRPLVRFASSHIIPRVRLLGETQNLAWAGLWLVVLATIYDRLSMIGWRIVTQATLFDGFPIDGAFQLLNPLRRMAEGQTPGADFQFFHGLGTLMIHYPLFTLFGGNLHASELSREIISPLLFIGTAVALAYVATRRWLPTLLALALLLLAYPYVSTLVISSNSLLGVRTATPLLVGAAVILLYQTYQKPRLHLAIKLITQLLLALAFFMGVEHGVAAIVAYFGTMLLLGDGPLWLRLVRAARDGVLIVLWIVAIFVAISGSHWLAPLKFALSELPADQFWYFGAPPNHFIYSKLTLISDRALMTSWIVGGVLLAILARYRTSRIRAQAIGFSFLILYGLIVTVAMLGIENAAYTQPLLRVLIIAMVCFGWLWFAHRLEHGRRYFALPLAGTALFLLILNVNPPDQLAGRPNPIDFTNSTTSGVRLSKAWDKYHTTMEKNLPDGATLWSTYASIPEAEDRTFNSSGYDYIIHALGPERRPEYLEKFIAAAPDYVQTIRYDFTKYEEWLQAEHWDWYQWVVTNYHFKAITPHSILWERNEAGPLKNPNDQAWLATIQEPAGEVSLSELPQNLPSYSIVTVEVEYEARSLFEPVPLIGRLPRYLIAAHASANSLPTSLPSYLNRWQFPVVTKDGRIPNVKPYIASVAPGGRFKITALRYRVMDLDERTRQALLARDPSVLAGEKPEFTQGL